MALVFYEAIPQYAIRGGGAAGKPEAALIGRDKDCIGPAIVSDVCDGYC